jgi:hypothetical protein
VRRGLRLATTFYRDIGGDAFGPFVVARTHPTRIEWRKETVRGLG